MVVAGAPTPTELAAVTAVLSAAIEDARSSGAETAEPRRSAWQRVQRPIRVPLSRGAGTWRSFSG